MHTALNHFQDAFENWQKRWDRCVRSQGDYFEGDGVEKDTDKTCWFLLIHFRNFWIEPRILNFFNNWRITCDLPIIYLSRMEW
jgi:hypothetical protein